MIDLAVRRKCLLSPQGRRSFDYVLSVGLPVGIGRGQLQCVAVSGLSQSRGLADSLGRLMWLSLPLRVRPVNSVCRLPAFPCAVTRVSKSPIHWCSGGSTAPLVQVGLLRFQLGDGNNSFAQLGGGRLSIFSGPPPQVQEGGQGRIWGTPTYTQKDSHDMLIILRRHHQSFGKVISDRSILRWQLGDPMLL